MDASLQQAVPGSYPPFQLSVAASTSTGDITVQAPAGAVVSMDFTVYLAAAPSPGVYADNDPTSCAVFALSTTASSYPFGTIGPVAGCNPEATQDRSDVTGQWSLTVASMESLPTGGYLLHGSIDATLVGELAGNFNGQSVNTHLDF